MSLLDLDDVDELLDQLDAVTTEGLTEALHPPDPPEASHSQTQYRQLAPAPVRNTPTSTARMPARDGAGGRRPCPQPLTEQERLLPMANVGRIMAMQLAKDAKISRDAKVLMQEMLSEFICFVSSESVDYAIEENNRTITHDAILGAMSRLDFDSFLPCLEMLHSSAARPTDEGASTSSECTSSDSKPAPPGGEHTRCGGGGDEIQRVP
jgi:histone H3/H4